MYGNLKLEESWKKTWKIVRYLLSKMLILKVYFFLPSSVELDALLEEKSEGR